MLQTNFEEWGPIERIYNVPSKTIAFVQYYWRASAEFAKEAMQVTKYRSLQVSSLCWGGRKLRHETALSLLLYRISI